MACWSIRLKLRGSVSSHSRHLALLGRLGAGDVRLVRAEAALAGAAVHHGVAEVLDVPGSASQVRGCAMMALSMPSTSGRARDHALPPERPSGCS